MDVSSMSLSQAVAHVAPTTLRDGCPREPSGRFDIIRDMLDLMETFTQEGQRYSMRKIVEFIEGHLRLLHSARHNHAMLLELLAALRRESEQPWPNSLNFSLRAKSLIALLEGTPDAPAPSIRA